MNHIKYITPYANIYIYNNDNNDMLSHCHMDCELGVFKTRNKNAVVHMLAAAVPYILMQSAIQAKMKTTGTRPRERDSEDRHSYQPIIRK